MPKWQPPHPRHFQKLLAILFKQVFRSELVTIGLGKINTLPDVKILVVDDHALVREGLRQVLRGLEDNTEVLQAGNCTQAFAHAASHGDIDLVLLDYHLPDMNGIEALEVFGQRHPELPVMLLSGTANLEVMHLAMRKGAAGFIGKGSLSDVLLHAVRRVLEGDIYIPPDLREEPSNDPDAEGKGRLTQRQELVLRSLLDGRSNKEIAESLHISEETVKSHVAAILRHFDVQNRTQAVVAAARAGYQSSPSRD